MIILDTNMILRYLLQDNIEQNQIAADIIENNEVLITNEVIVEVCYVLYKTYHIEKEVIFSLILEMMSLDNVNFLNRAIIYETFKNFMTEKLDIVDCMLIAYKKCQGLDIATFDEKLEKKLKQI